MANTIITISRTYGSGGRKIGKLLAERAGIPYYDRELIYLTSAKSGLPADVLSDNDEGLSQKRPDVIIPEERNKYISKDEVFASQSRTIRELADKSDCVIIGRCADSILKNSPHRLVRVFVWAPKELCISRVSEMFSITGKEAAKMIKQIDKHREDYYKYHTGAHQDSARNFDLCIDTSRVSFEQAVGLISGYSRMITEL